MNSNELNAHGISSDDPNTEIHKGTRVLYKGRDIGVVLAIHWTNNKPAFYVQFPHGTVVLAFPEDLQNINDKREG